MTSSIDPGLAAERRLLVVIPTYDERENIRTATTAVHAAAPTAHILIVDDNSPDGTGVVADGIAASDPRVFVLHRMEKSGLGGAYIAGFRWGLERDYEILAEFDADGSHPASALPRMLRALDSGGDLVIGSRWVRGARVVDWPVSREILSRAGNAYARLMLRLPVRDSTGGYRLIRANVLRSVSLDAIESKGYCFQVDMTVRAHDAGARIVEVPIEFRERTLGASKMSRAIVVEAMMKVTVWGLRRRFGRRRAEFVNKLSRA